MRHRVARDGIALATRRGRLAHGGVTRRCTGGRPAVPRRRTRSSRVEWGGARGDDNRRWLTTLHPRGYTGTVFTDERGEKKRGCRLFRKNFLPAEPLVFFPPVFDGTTFARLSPTPGDKVSHRSRRRRCLRALDGSPAATRLNLVYTLRAHDTTAGSHRRRRCPAAFAARLCHPLVALYLERGFQNASADAAAEPAGRRRLHRPMQRSLRRRCEG